MRRCRLIKHTGGTNQKSTNPDKWGSSSCNLSTKTEDGTLGGILKKSNQVVYSNAIPNRLSYQTQPSKAGSSSSTVGDRPSHQNSSGQSTRQHGGEVRVYLAADVNRCILLGRGNVLPKLSLFSLTSHNSKTGYSHPSIGYYKAKISNIHFRESSHNTLEMTRPRHSTPELESFITQPGHPQRNSRTSDEIDLQQIKALVATHNAIIQQAHSHVTSGRPQLPLHHLSVVPTQHQANRRSKCLTLSPNVDSCFYIPYTFLSSQHLLLSTGFDPAFIAFHGLRPSIHCFPRASAQHLQLFMGFGSGFTAFHGLRPSIYYFPQASTQHLHLSHGFRPSIYYFPRASAQHLQFSTSFGPTFTAFHGFRPSIYCLGFGLTSTALHGLRFSIYCFPRLSTGFGLAFTAFHRLQPNIYSFPQASAYHLQPSTGFGQAFSAFHGFRPCIYCFPRASQLSTDFGSAFTTLMAPALPLPLYGLRPSSTVS
ncbi:hypothetical protein CRG98_010747 [Punica granatum]|uniref:Uncharacterized protein n=1 Tax=Punica granatum TaxID=22663 RepID=A0A2I0KK50_PUNGR|nr:hypothetical protein CRG98_010747 [Punica granatum]